METNYSNIDFEDDVSNNLNEVLNSFAIEVDLIDSWKKLYKDGNQFGNRYYQDIDYKTKENFFNNSKEKNTETLVDYINDIFSNFVHLSGDKKFGEDAAIICGIGKIAHQSVLIIHDDEAI